MLKKQEFLDKFAEICGKNVVYDDKSLYNAYVSAKKHPIMDNAELLAKLETLGVDNVYMGVRNYYSNELLLEMTPQECKEWLYTVLIAKNY